MDASYVCMYTWKKIPCVSLSTDGRPLSPLKVSHYYKSAGERPSVLRGTHAISLSNDGRRETQH